MKLQSEINGKALILTIDGDLIGENSGAEILGHVTDSLDGVVNSCALNLTNVRYMNSSGIGVLITLLTKITNKKGDFILISPSEQVQKLLQITKLTDVFKIVKSEEEAISFINK